jgi:flagellar hook-associated protein 3 FlgL
VRIGTAYLFQATTRGMLNNQADLLRTQQQLSTGRRLLVPSDDPGAAGQAHAVRADEALAAQLAASRSTARSALELAEGRLGAASGLLSSARSLIVAAGNGALAPADRQSIALELRSLYDELLGMANSRDGEGRYLFAGYQDTAQPFTQTTSGVLYNGDQGRRALAAAGSREIGVGENGHAVFESARSGNGIFKATLAGANTGTASIGPGGVYDGTLLTGNSYRVTFGAGTYDVLDTTSGTVVSTGTAYASGVAIRFDGIEIPIEGAPAAGDRIDVQPSSGQSIFRTLKDAIDAVAGSGAAPVAAAEAQRRSGLARALVEVDAAADRILATRAMFGASLRELDDLDSIGEEERVQLAARRSKLEDLDYAKAVSDFERQRQALEAAQQTHARMAALSLFNFIG